MEFITDISIRINEAAYEDRGRLMSILQSYSPGRIGSCYVVRGSFKELEKLSNKLLDVRHDRSPGAHGHRPTLQQTVRTQTPVGPLDVSVAVMAYIKQKCAKDLRKIEGDRFVIRVQPAPGSANGSGTERVTFKPRDVSANPVHAHFVRKRFVTFYQRTASDLQHASVPASPHDRRDLQRRFPQLLFYTSSQDKNRPSVVGPFVHVAKLKEFLSQNPVPGPVNRGAAAAHGSRSGAVKKHSPERSKEPEEETCPICMEPIARAEKETLPCKHSFCRDCLKQSFAYKPVCPTCGTVYGVLKGTQPDGRMDFTKTDSSLPGYEKYGTIVISYHIPSGIQKEEHPNPGQPYEGASRTAYLPASPEGKRTLGLLQRAFRQRLLFTVGRSTTTGRSNTVTWNDIHHKTSTHGGPTSYGYPDPDYLSRVQDELKAKGIE